MKYHRRHFLAALGAASLSSSVGREAQASTGSGTRPRQGYSPASGQPLRFFGVYTPHGCAYEHYTPRGDFDFTGPLATLSPFEDEVSFGKKYKEQLTLVDGVDLSAGLLVGTVGHDAPRVILTGSGATGKNPSIDQYLAVEQALGADTLFTSLVLAVGNQQSGLENNISYSAGGSPVPKTIDPRALFDQLFGQALSGLSPEQLEARRRLDKSVLDFARQDLKKLERSAPAQERSKLDQHATALRDIEKRLSKKRPECTTPGVPRAFPQLTAYGGGEPYFDEISELMIDLSVRALACDLTRFCTIFLADLSRAPNALGLPEDIHQAVAHVYQARSEKNPGRPETWHQLALQNRDSYKKVARLTQRLDESGILDDSIVYASGELGDPSRHSSRHVPSLLLGRAGGAWNPGKYLDLRKAHIPNNRILVSICQAFGVEMDRFGDSPSSSIVTGNLNELLERETSSTDGSSPKVTPQSSSTKIGP